ncbi:MAG: hypothetical protein BWY57_02940 [Betaproteobacteria bacterium ADurb.Bin341]|nr:MAG: hypothetical protein BWY57_02940 [Betaproteobacteria bacterium ADurb.Bin341]
MREIVDMEHMLIRWEVRYDEESQQYDIVTEEDGLFWVIASIPLALPGDYDGEKTAKAICELHNRSLTSNAAGQGREAYPAPPCSDIEIVRRNADKLLVNVTGTGMAFADWLDSIGIRATRVRIMSHGIERA